MSDFESCDEDLEYEGIMKKALHVELPKNFDPNKIPQTGEEYLQKVIYERAQCKTWVTANIDRSKFENKQTFRIEIESDDVTTPSTLVPSKQWQLEKLADFTKFRHFISFKLPSNEPVLTLSDEDTFIDRILVESPKFSEMVQYSQAAKIRMLQIISKNLSLNENMGAWIYAILTLLEIPLNPSFCHSLREFCKSCIRLRSKMVEENCVSLNLFICIIGRFFNQLDLADSYLET